MARPESLARIVSRQSPRYFAMTCDTWKTKLDAYIDSELSDNELYNLELHLRECPSCAAASLGRLQLKRTRQAAGTHYLPTPQFRLHIENSIKAKRKSRWLLGWIPKLAAAGAFVLLLVGSIGLWMRHSQREQALTELADLHVATLASANPVDVVSTDRHTVKPWFQGKIPFTFNLPDLQNTDFTLVGGRVTYLGQVPGAHLIYQVRKHQISVFMFPEDLVSLRTDSKTAK